MLFSFKRLYTFKMVNTNKQKPLLPTLKERQRYVVYSVITEFNDMPKSEKINKTTTDNSNNTLNGVSGELIVEEINKLLGIFDGAKAGLVNLGFNRQTMKGILRVTNTHVDKVRVCLGLLRELNGHKVILNTIYVSGMLNKAKQRSEVK